MKLVRSLFFIAAKRNFHVLIRHIPGSDNSIADSLSRMQMERFRELAPLAAPTATPIPANPTGT
jgi:predicted alpha/beta hydrolase